MSIFNCSQCNQQLKDESIQHTRCCGNIICNSCAQSFQGDQNGEILDNTLNCSNCISDIKNNKLQKNIYLDHLMYLNIHSKANQDFQKQQLISQFDQDNADILIERFNQNQTLKQDQFKITCGRCKKDSIPTLFICEICSNNNLKDLNSKEHNSYSAVALSQIAECQQLCEDCSKVIHSIGDYQQHNALQIPETYFLQQIANQQQLFEESYLQKFNDNIKYDSMNFEDQSLIKSQNNIFLQNNMSKNTNQAKVRKCNIHQNQIYNRICMKDNQLLCNQCNNEHANMCYGNIIDIDTAFREFNHTLFMNIETLLQQQDLLQKDSTQLQSMIQKLNDLKNNSMMIVKTQIQDIITLLKEKEDQMLRQIDISIQQKQFSLQDYFNQLNFKIQQQKSFINLLYSTINSDQKYKFDLLSSKAFFQSKYIETINFEQQQSITSLSSISSRLLQPIEIYQFEDIKQYISTLSIKGFNDEKYLNKKSSMNLSKIINEKCSDLQSNNVKNLAQMSSTNFSNSSNPSQNNLYQQFTPTQNSGYLSQQTSLEEFSINLASSTSQTRLRQDLSPPSSLNSMAIGNDDINNKIQEINDNNENSVINNNEVENKMNQKNICMKNNIMSAFNEQSTTNTSDISITQVDFRTKSNTLDNQNKSNSNSNKYKDSFQQIVQQKIENTNISQIQSICESYFSTIQVPTFNDIIQAKNQKQTLQNCTFQQKTNKHLQQTNPNKILKPQPERRNKNIPCQITQQIGNENLNLSFTNNKQTPSTPLLKKENTPIKRSPKVDKKSLDPAITRKPVIRQNSLASGKQNQKGLEDINDILSNHDLIQQCELSKNPLLKRIITKTHSNSTSIMLQWTHLPNFQKDIKYTVEFGIGIKIGGREQFKQVYFGSSPNYIIEGLQPKTTYRIRVCANQSKKNDCFIQDSQKEMILYKYQNEISNNVNKEIPEQEEDTISGEWSEIQSVCTQDLQSIEQQECAQIVRKEQEIIVSYYTPGIVTSLYPYHYGKITWDLTASVDSHGCGEDTTACLIVGVTNKQNKKYSIVGSTINYGLHNELIKIKATLDFNKKTLIIYTPQKPQGEIFNNLPSGGLYPAFQNKTKQKTTLSSLKLKIIFEDK